jgi:hypothetical protein
MRIHPVDRRAFTKPPNSRAVGHPEAVAKGGGTDVFPTGSRLSFTNDSTGSIRDSGWMTTRRQGPSCRHDEEIEGATEWGESGKRVLL